MKHGYDRFGKAKKEATQQHKKSGSVTAGISCRLSLRSEVKSAERNQPPQCMYCAERTQGSNATKLEGYCSTLVRETCCLGNSRAIHVTRLQLLRRVAMKGRGVNTTDIRDSFPTPFVCYTGARQAAKVLVLLCIVNPMILYKAWYPKSTSRVGGWSAQDS